MEFLRAYGDDDGEEDVVEEQPAPTPADVQEEQPAPNAPTPADVQEEQPALNAPAPDVQVRKLNDEALAKPFQRTPLSLPEIRRKVVESLPLPRNSVDEAKQDTEVVVRQAAKQDLSVVKHVTKQDDEVRPLTVSQNKYPKLKNSQSKQLIAHYTEPEHIMKFYDEHLRPMLENLRKRVASIMPRSRLCFILNYILGGEAYIPSLLSSAEPCYDRRTIEVPLEAGVGWGKRFMGKSLKAESKGCEIYLHFTEDRGRYEFVVDEDGAWPLVAFLGYGWPVDFIFKKHLNVIIAADHVLSKTSRLIPPPAVLKKQNKKRKHESEEQEHEKLALQHPVTEEMYSRLSLAAMDLYYDMTMS